MLEKNIQINSLLTDVIANSYDFVEGKIEFYEFLSAHNFLNTWLTSYKINPIEHSEYDYLKSLNKLTNVFNDTDNINPQITEEVRKSIMKLFIKHELM